jgi:phenylpyruvate tautomerase PptA (4-oxalocrotonate tautomerase family)
MKAALFARVVQRLQEAAGVRPEDVMVVISEASPEDWSFSGGIQWHAPAPDDARG